MTLKRFSLILLSLMLIASCSMNRDKKKSLDRIKALETSIYGDSVTVIEAISGMELIQAYTDFVNSYPDDTQAPEYLYKGAEIAMNLRMSGMAIEYYKRILKSYPDFEKNAYCVFLQAFILENQMSQFDQAKAVYEEFIHLYPDHVLANDARLSVQNMGVPIEDLIKSWEEKNSD